MKPYTKAHGIADLQYIHHNEESMSWYDPLKPYTLLEYEWVRENCKLEGETVIDAGCHHGNYSIVFKPAFVVAIDNIAANCLYAKENMVLNGVECSVQCYTMGADGAKTNRKPGIYKVDIEGAEFILFPAELRRFPSVHTWIIEIHPAQGDPNQLAQMFHDAGFTLLKVCREAMAVRPYQIGERWRSHSTLIAQRPQGGIARKP